MIFFNNNLAMGEPIIIESLPNTRPSPTTKFIVPEHIVGTTNLFIFVDGELRRDYVDTTWSTIEFTMALPTTAYFVAILFVSAAQSEDEGKNFYKLFLEGKEGQVIFNSPKDLYGVKNDYTLNHGYYLEHDSEMNWSAIDETDFEEIFNTWEVFSHGLNGLFPSSLSETTGWRFENNRIISTLNSTTYIGWVQPEPRVSYNIQGRLKSSSTDDDSITVVIAFRRLNGKEYTLSAVRNNEDFGHRWALVYNFRQTDEWVVADGSDLVRAGTGSWAGNPNGVFIKAEKNAYVVRAWTSEMNELDIQESSLLEVNLMTDNRLLIFSEPTQSGYGCWSQENSTFEDIDAIQMFAYNIVTNTSYKYTPATGWISTVHNNIGDVLGYGRFWFNEHTNKLFYTRKDNSSILVSRPSEPLTWNDF